MRKKKAADKKHWRTACAYTAFTDDHLDKKHI